MDRKIYGIYFICCIGNYYNIVLEQLNKIIDSGLYENTENIYCFICMKTNDIIELLSTYTKIKIISTDAINNFRDYLPDVLYYIYYLHTKTITRSDQWFTDWRILCEHFTIYKWKLNISLLKKNDAVGINFFQYPKLHFSGNFWWSKSEHIKQLKSIGDKYLAPEMFICSNVNGKYVSMYNLFSLGNNHPPDLYINISDTQIIEILTTIPVNNI